MSGKPQYETVSLKVRGRTFTLNPQESDPFRTAITLCELMSCEVIVLKGKSSGAKHLANQITEEAHSRLQHPKLRGGVLATVRRVQSAVSSNMLRFTHNGVSDNAAMAKAAKALFRANEHNLLARMRQSRKAMEAETSVANE